MLEKTRNFAISLFQLTVYRFVKKENYHLLQNNKKYKNRHKGERCFILGNGPSLKEQDLSKLCDEYVFTVNQSSRNSQFKDLQPNYHFWIDQAFFKENGETDGIDELIQTMRDVVCGSNTPVCFFPINQHKFVKKYKLDEVLNINYISLQYTIVDEKFPVDLSKSIPCVQTVVQACIIAAIYMGFSDIYLLGCDNTGIVVNINSFLKKGNDGDYAYTISEKEKKRMENLFSSNTLETYALAFYKNLVSYRNIAKYCSKHNIGLYNCTPESTIESIKKIRYDEVLN